MVPDILVGNTKYLDPVQNANIIADKLKNEKRLSDELKSELEKENGQFKKENDELKKEIAELKKKKLFELEIVDTLKNKKKKLD